MSTICLIFGRRAGTSSLSKALFEKGYPFRGPLDTRPMLTNKDGHYESYECRAINGGMLRHFRTNDKYPGLVPFLIHQGVEQWLADEEAPQAYVVKEPRLCLTWPTWYRTCKASNHKLVAIWCRRPREGQIRSLMTSKGYEYERDDAEYCVTMYEHSISLASQMIPTLQLWIEPETPRQWIRSLFREGRAARWLRKHGIEPNQGEYHARSQEDEEGGSQEAEEGGSQEAEEGGPSGGKEGRGEEALGAGGRPDVIIRP